MIDIIENKEHPNYTNVFSKEYALKVNHFHQSLPGYKPTDLVTLKHLSKYLGLGSLSIKDESTRFGLNAFKGLGGSYCMARYISQLCHIPIEDLNYEVLHRQDIQEKIKNITFVSATDGNHGRGIAWTAHLLGVEAVIYLPKGSASERAENIRKLGAKAIITDLNYDDTVRFAAQCEKEKGWVLVQDTSWDGYETIPTTIMQGYTTIGLEIISQLEYQPTHIFLQAGVGAFSGALAAFFGDYYKDHKPYIIIVESNQADCLFKTVLAHDGTLHKVSGDLHTIMAGLACGEPCTIGYKMLEEYADYFVSVSDDVSKRGMRVLGNPLKGDQRIISGESGAVTSGVVFEAMRDEKLKEMLHLDDQSHVLCISTEGDTDQENYRKVVWGD